MSIDRAPRQRMNPITRLDLVAWEAAGSPRHYCDWNHLWVRTGLDGCCTSSLDCGNKLDAARGTQPR